MYSLVKQINHSAGSHNTLQHSLNGYISLLVELFVACALSPCQEIFKILAAGSGTSTSLHTFVSLIDKTVHLATRYLLVFLTVLYYVAVTCRHQSCLVTSFSSATAEAIELYVIILMQYTASSMFFSPLFSYSCYYS